MGIEAMHKDRARGERWAKDLPMDHVHAILDAMILGEFDWRDYFDSKPSAPFLNAAFNAAQYREEMAGYDY